MMIRVNKHTNRRPARYAAMLSGTVSAVWSDDEASANAPKRRNRIRLTREKAQVIQQAEQYDA
ncbi:MAG: hypothetical protein ACKVOE_08095 [Rickettsiales bacterium]